MNDKQGTRIDDEASRSIQRIESQMFLDGKLDKAVGVEGFAFVGLLVLAVVTFFASSLLEGLGISEATRKNVVMGLAASLIVGGLVWFSNRMQSYQPKGKP
jgi:hypothetical protein